MSLPAFATAAELCSILQRDSIDTATADLLLDNVSHAIRSEVQQQVNLVTGEQVTLDGPPTANWWEGGAAYMPADAAIYLPEHPVLNVSALTEDGNTLTNNTDFVWKPNGQILRIVSGQKQSLKLWSVKPRSIVVTYDHGWATTTWQYSAVKAVCLQVAARSFVNPEYIQSQSIGQYQVRYGRIGSLNIDAAGPIQFTFYEKSMLDSVRRTML